jgi:DNA-binding protein HU-beta
MNKAELVDTIANQTGLTKAQSAKALDAFTNSVQRALKAGEKVTLVGFGTFETRSVKARTGRNPANGQSITIPSKRVARFSAGKALKNAVK